MFILDRTNGKPVFGVEERPVPKGDVPGEWYSPTQPFPLKPPPLARVSFKPEDMVTAEDTTPEHAKACREVYEKNGGFYNAGPFTAWLFHQDGTPPKSTIQFPGGTGGVNWGGTAADPKTGYVFLNTHDGSLTGWIEKKKPGGNYGRGTEGSHQPYDRASVDGPGPYHGFSATVKDANGRVIGTWPCQKPPWARLVAVNANTGDIAWQSPLGLVEGLPEGKQNCGSERQRRTSGHRRRIGFHRRDERSSVSRVRLEDRQRAMGREIEQNRERESDDVPGQERQAIRRDYGDGFTGRVCVAVSCGSEP